MAIYSHQEKRARVPTPLHTLLSWLELPIYNELTVTDLGWSCNFDVIGDFDIRLRDVFVNVGIRIFPASTDGNSATQDDIFFQTVQPVDTTRSRSGNQDASCVLERSGT